MKLYLDDGTRCAIDPADAIGKGGEADVYRIGRGRALKLFKTPSHPDVSGSAELEAAAARRLDEHQRKLRDFPRGLPERVVAPEALAFESRRGRRLVGYAMREIAGAELLARYADPRFRRRLTSGNAALEVMRDLHGTVAALHGFGVVIGDFNDLNVLVADRRAYLIDADSYQFGPYRCELFTERFVDPLCCDPSARSMVMAAPHTTESDWYAYAIVLMRTLLCVGPYGGVFRPKDPSRRVPHIARPLARVTVFDPEVVYPKPAIHYRTLPDDLLEYFEDTFVRDRRGPPPRQLIEVLRWTRCSRCGSEHARLVCPSCIGAARSDRVTVRVRGNVTAEVLFRGPGPIVDATVVEGRPRWLCWDGEQLRREDGVALAQVAPAPGRRFARWGNGALIGEGARLVAFDGAGTAGVRAVDTCRGLAAFAPGVDRCFWIEGGRLMRDGLLGPVHIGDVLARQTRIWMGGELGFGFYRAGGLTVAFLFHRQRQGLIEVIDPLGLRGELVEQHCAIAADRVWLFATEKVCGSLRARAWCIDSTGAVIAVSDSPAAELAWTGGTAGACATGSILLVPTDDGVVRVEADAGALSVTQTFPDTEPFVDRTSLLLPGAAGLLVVGERTITKLSLS